MVLPLQIVGITVPTSDMNDIGKMILFEIFEHRKLEWSYKESIVNAAMAEIFFWIRRQVMITSPTQQIVTRHKSWKFIRRAAWVGHDWNTGKNGLETENIQTATLIWYDMKTTRTFMTESLRLETLCSTISPIPKVRCYDVVAAKREWSSRRTVKEIGSKIKRISEQW